MEAGLDSLNSITSNPLNCTMSQGPNANRHLKGAIIWYALPPFLVKTSPALIYMLALSVKINFSYFLGKHIRRSSSISLPESWGMKVTQKVAGSWGAPVLQRFAARAGISFRWRQEDWWEVVRTHWARCGQAVVVQGRRESQVKF